MSNRSNGHRSETLASSTPPSAPLKSLDQLLSEQGVEPVTRIEQLAGPSIDDFDEFMSAVRSVRA
jgi:hypothetical protein